jgi:hypothetical protein
MYYNNDGKHSFNNRREHMKIFEAIEKRHSTRNYESEKLSENVKREIETICDGVKPFQEVKCTWDVKEDEKATGKIFSEIDSTKWESLVNYGFEGEQIILRLTQADSTLKVDSTLWKALDNREKTPAILRFGKGKESGAIIIAFSNESSAMVFF